MTEATRTTFGFRERLHLHGFDLFAFGDDQLRDAVAAIDDKGFVGEVNEDDAHLSTVVGVDGAGRVQDGVAALDGQYAAGTHLSLVAFGDLHIETRRHKATLHGFEGDGAIGQIGAEVHASRVHGLVSGQGVI